jgi:tetraacyldisaccharide 4'-kinase
VLPSGTLREFKTGAGRADLIIVTKTPKIFSPITRRRIIDDIKPLKHQTVLFSFLKYGELVPVFDTLKMEIPGRVTNILLFTGIANDYPLSEHLARTCSEVVPVKFPDHHVYSEKDIARISQTFHNLPTQKKLIVTTEKDVMRLKTPELSTILKNLPLFYVPVEVDFHGTDKQLFDNVILSYVNKNKRNH